jgi:hypothetical protein
MSNELMNKKTKTLTPQERLFCSNYCSIGTPTFSKAEKSAIAAGYSEKSARNTATDLLKRDDIKAYIYELNADNLTRNGVTTDKVLQDLEHTRLLSIEKGDYSTATRCSELQGKYLSLFHADHQPAQNLTIKVYDAHQLEQARIAAQLLLESGLGRTLGQGQETINVKFTDKDLPTTPNTTGSTNMQSPPSQHGHFSDVSDKTYPELKG